MSQVPQDWKERDFIESVECGIRKCVDFLNNFHESAKYRLSVVDARLSTLERKLDFLEASLEHCDPAQRHAKPAPFTGSIFDPEVRRKLISQNEQMRLQNRRKFNDLVIAPRKTEKKKPIQKTSTQQRPQTQPVHKQQTQHRPPTQTQPRTQPQSQSHSKPQSKPQPKPQPKAEPKVQQQPPAVPPVVPPVVPQSAQQSQPPPGPGAPGAGPGAKQQPPPIPSAQHPPSNPVQQQPPPAPGPGAGGPPPNPVAPVKQQEAAVQQPPPAVPNVAVQKPPAVPGPPGPPKAPGAGPGAAAMGGGPGAAVPPPPGPGAPANAAKEWPNRDGNQIDILMVKEGAGAVAGGQSAVEIEYTGHLGVGGKQFIKHREVIQLGKKMNIKGLEQAVTRIKVGSTIKLWIPSRLAYGVRGAGNLIPPHQDLVFNLMLHRIVKQ